METKANNQSLLQEFLQTLEIIPSDFIESLMNITSDEDEKIIIGIINA